MEIFNMARTKFHITPETGKLNVSLTKRQLKEFKKMSIEFEMTLDDIIQVALDVFIKKYQSVTSDEIDKHGIKSILDNK